jgi:hypothetical protein
MGYRGRVEDRAQARARRAEAGTLAEIAAELGVARSTVSLWVRDVAFVPRPRNRGAPSQRVHPQRAARLAQIEELRALGIARIGELSRKEHLVAGVALYAGEGAKTDGVVKFANSDPRMILFFVTWLRAFFAVDESRLRLRLYLHQGLDLAEANQFWSELTDIPLSQFGAAYRAVPDSTIRSTKHVRGCASVVYACSRTHRAIMGLVEALLTSAGRNPG